MTDDKKRLKKDEKEEYNDLDGKNWDERCHKAYDSDKMKDITFLFEEDDKIITLKAHKLLLAICCPVFDKMFYGPHTLSNNNQESLGIHIKDIRSNVFNKFLKLIYNQNLLPNLDIDDIHGLERAQFLVDLLYTSKKYMFKALQNAVVEYINSNIETQNAYFYFQQGKLFGEIDSQTCWEVLLENGEEFIGEDSFLDMTASDLLKLLLDDKLNAEEVDLLKATLKWAEHNMGIEKREIKPVNMRHFLGEEILCAIRYPLLNNNDFYDLVIKTNFLSAEEGINVCLSKLEFERQTDIVFKFCIKPRKPVKSYFFSKILMDDIDVLEYTDDKISIKNKSSNSYSIKGVYILPLENDQKCHDITVYDDSKNILTSASISSRPSVHSPFLNVNFDKSITVGPNVEKMKIEITFSSLVVFKQSISSWKAIKLESLIIKPGYDTSFFISGVII